MIPQLLLLPAALLQLLHLPLLPAWALGVLGGSCVLLHAAVAPAAAKSAAACCKASSNAFPSLPPGAMSRPAKTSPLKHSTLPWLSTKGLVLRLLPRSCSSDAARCSSTCAVLLCWLPCAVLLSLVSEVAAVVVLAPAPSGHGTDTDTCKAPKWSGPLLLRPGTNVSALLALHAS